MAMASPISWFVSSPSDVFLRRAGYYHAGETAGMGIVSGVGAFNQTPFLLNLWIRFLRKNRECVPGSGTMADPLKSAES
jgi:hypothetical protein